MPHNRAAIDTIRGYFYQFDYFILSLLEASHESDTICIEGIEDVDINSADETIAIQCKYYAGTEYNHSVLGKPIRLMLEHYAPKKEKCRYVIYGHYSSGQHKLPDSFDIQFFKKHFLTYSGNKLYEELKLDDRKLTAFMQSLTININAPSYEEQEKQIYVKIKEIFSCSDYEADFYYNNALQEVKKLSTMKDEKDRKLKKNEFVSRINKKDFLFDIWFLKKKGIDKYCKSIKSQFFTKYNISPYERFFLLECDDLISTVDLKVILQNISKKWSKLSRYSKHSFCPYVYLHNISDSKLIEIKKLLQSDGFYFIDGYDFNGADFSVNSICRRATNKNEILLKIVNEQEQITHILRSMSGTREIYQFFRNKIFYVNTDHKHIKICIEGTSNINDII